MHKLDKVVRFEAEKFKNVTFDFLFEMKIQH